MTKPPRNYLDAEDAALRYWLGPKPKGHDDNYEPLP
jgi:hypothetical protein